MQYKIEKQLRDLWKKIRNKDAPLPNVANDIEEFLSAGEWELALEHILDWAAAENKLPQAETQAKQIKAEMVRLSVKKSN